MTSPYRPEYGGTDPRPGSINTPAAVTREKEPSNAESYRRARNQVVPGRWYRLRGSGAKFLARSTPQSGVFDLYLQNDTYWGSQASYQLRSDGRIYHHGSPTAWFTSDLQATYA